MSILIKGLKMPKNGTCIDIVIFDDGNDDDRKICEAVELQLDEITAAHEQIGYDRGFNDGYASALFDEGEDEDWYTAIDDPKFDERSEDEAD